MHTSAGWLNFLLILVLATTTYGNTEKIIFVAPKAIPIPNVHPGLDDLRLSTLSHFGRRSLVTSLPVKFPADEEPRGTQSWYLLQNLQEGQRYEVRICWAATQPTAFWLDTFPITEVFESPPLIQGLAAHSETRQSLPIEHSQTSQPSTTTESVSVLFLRVHSAADYFTLNATLMEQPEDVLVDIILDPYLLNIFPASLVPTAGYISILAVLGWFLSNWIYTQLSSLAATSGNTPLHTRKGREKTT